MGSTKEHEKLVCAVLKAIGSRDEVRIWENKTGGAYRGGRLITYGLVGSADILGITNAGQFLAIECKSGNAQLSREQRAFRDVIWRYGGIFIVARSVKSVLQKLETLKIL